MKPAADEFIWKKLIQMACQLMGVRVEIDTTTYPGEYSWWVVCEHGHPIDHTPEEWNIFHMAAVAADEYRPPHIAPSRALAEMVETHERKMSAWTN